MLFWLVVADQLWKKHQRLCLGSSRQALLVGVLLIAWVLVQSIKGADISFLRLSPFVAAVSLGLLASGFQGLKQYWQELLILFFLGVPRVILSPPLLDISPLTAQFSAFLLWCCGFEVSLQGVEILLPEGGVLVYEGCSGIEAMTYLLGLSVIFLVIFPTRKLMKFLVPFVGLSLGFVVNGGRVALLATLVAAKQLEAFHYWHEGDGSKLFAIGSVVLFSLFCLNLVRQQQTNT
jgi:cyanoexosortase A